MTFFLIMSAALIAEISLGGFLGFMNGSFHLYAFTFIAVAFLIQAKRINNLSLVAGIMADLFLNSHDFFGFFLILYFILGQFIAWSRSIFFKTGDFIALSARFFSAVLVYAICLFGLFGLEKFVSAENGIKLFFNARFLTGEILGFIFAAITFVFILRIFRVKNA